jgi:cell wall-associated NlpC family hydrolase
VIPPGAWKEEAYHWIGTPYLTGGMSRNGVDCSGFVVLIYRAVAGVALPRTSQQQFFQGISVHPNDLKPGDLVFFQTTGAGVGHVGLSLGGREFVHASTRKGVIVTSLQEPYYASHFYGAKRILP